MAVGFRANVSVVVVDLDVAPERADSVSLDAAEHVRLARVRDVDERRAVGGAHDGDFVSCLWISPAPNIVPASGWASAKVLERDERELVDVRALVLSGLAPLAWHGARRRAWRWAALFELAERVLRQLMLHQVHTVHAAVLVALLAFATVA